MPVTLTNTPTALEAEIAALDGTQDIKFLMKLKKACIGAGVDYTAVDAAITTVDGNIATDGSAALNDLLYMGASAGGQVVEEEKGAPLPKIVAPHLNGDAVLAGDRGYLGLDIYNGEARFIPRNNLGKTVQYGDNLVGWQSGGSNNHLGRTRSVIVDTSDGNAIVVGFLRSTEYNAGSTSTDAHTYVLDGSDSWNIIHSKTHANSNILHNEATYLTGHIDVQEVEENFFVGFVQSHYASNSIRSYIFSFCYDPTSKQVVNEYWNILESASGSSYSNTYYGQAALAYRVSDRRVLMMSHHSSLLNVSYQRMSNREFTVTGTGNSRILTGQVNKGNSFAIPQFWNQSRLGGRFFYSSDGKLLSLVESLSHTNSTPNYVGTSGTTLTAMDPDDYTVIQGISLDPDLPSGTMIAGTHKYYGHRPLALGQISADEFILLTYNTTTQGSQDYHILRVLWNTGSQTFTVEHKGSIPYGTLRGVPRGVEIDNMMGSGIRHIKYDQTNRQFTIVSVACVNVVTLNPDLTPNMELTRSFSAKGLLPLNPANGEHIQSQHMGIQCCMVRGTDHLLTLESFNRTPASESGTARRDYAKMCLLLDVNIKQVAGSWGYPLTSVKSSSQGEDVESYGIAKGYVSLSGGKPFTRFDDVFILTDTVATTENVPEDIVTLSTPTYYSQQSGELFDFGEYAAGDSTSNITISRLKSNINLTDGDITQYLTDTSDYNSFAVSFYGNGNNNYFAGIFVEVDGFLRYMSDGDLNIQTTSSTIQYTYVIEFRNVDLVKIWAGAETSGMRMRIYDK